MSETTRRWIRRLGWFAGLDEPLILYIDEYSFSTLYAPVGFTCGGDFPLVAP